MASANVTVSLDETDRTVAEAHAAPAELNKLKVAIPLWSKILLSFLTLVRPLLCVVTVIFRLAFRAQPPRDRNAMTSFLFTRLVISGLLTTVAFALLLSLVPLPAIVNTGLPELDERTDFPPLSANTVLSSADVSHDLKPLVIVVSPTVTSFWTHQEMRSSSFGAPGTLAVH